MLTAQLMASMDDRHLVASIYAEQDMLTSSAAEIELLARFEALLEQQNTETTVALLEALGEAGIDDPASLRADLELAKTLRALTKAAGDVFTRLSQITTEQE